MQGIIRSDAESIRSAIVKTPLVELRWLGNAHRRVFAKLECLQWTGSFKVRGAYNALRKLPPEQAVYTASAGNHGLALATIAETLNRKANIFVPLTASEVKIRRLRNRGARIVQVGRDVAEAYSAASEEAERVGGAYISPFDHPDVVAGQGTLMMEVAAQHGRHFDHLFLPFGGGGMLTGAGLAANAIWPQAQLHGVLPAAFDRDMREGSFATSMMSAVMPTIADGLAIQHGADNWLWPLIRQLQPQFHHVSEQEIKGSILTLLHQESLLTEGAGAIALAPLLYEQVPDVEGDILVVLSGGNLSVPQMAKIISSSIEDPVLRKLNGLRASRLGIELDAAPQALAHRALSSSEDLAQHDVEPSETVSGSIWLPLVEHVEQALHALESTFDLHLRYVSLEALREDAAVRPFIENALRTTRELIDSCREPNLSNASQAARYRLLIQQFALARSALSWCSASTDQSLDVMFFDPAEQQASGVNYDRYGTTELRRLERRMAVAMGFADGETGALLTSSGQAAYSTLESFFLREVLAAPGSGQMSIARVPYFYFEAMEQLQSIPHLNEAIAEDWSVEALMRAVARNDARIVFADPMANIKELSTFDFRGLARALEGQDWSHRWLVVDGTMVSGGLNLFEIFREPHHPKILYFESGSKYLQFGLDLQMAGVIVAREEYLASIARHRRNLGAGLYQCQVARFPMYDREDLMARMQRLSRNAGQLAQALSSIRHARSHLTVAYPQDWREKGWAHGGAVVAVSFADEGLNNRPGLEGLIDNMLSLCRAKGIGLTKGVSFGFGTTRVSAAAAIAETTDPFLRFSVGEETVEEVNLLIECVEAAIAQYLNQF